MSEKKGIKETISLNAKVILTKGVSENGNDYGIINVELLDYPLIKIKGQFLSKLDLYYISNEYNNK
jgi:hypothetical protein